MSTKSKIVAAIGTILALLGLKFYFDHQPNIQNTVDVLPDDDTGL